MIIQLLTFICGFCSGSAAVLFIYILTETIVRILEWVGLVD